MANPYTPPDDPIPNATNINPALLRQRLSRVISVPVGAIAGGFFAGIAAFGLALIILMSSLSIQLGLGGVFDGLLIYALPMFAFPGGAMGGALLGRLYLETETWLANGDIGRDLMCHYSCRRVLSYASLGRQYCQERRRSICFIGSCGYMYVCFCRD